MDKITIKNNFAITTKRIKNDANGNPKYELSIYVKYGQNEEYENINILVNEKKLINKRYNKTKNIFTLTSYNINETIESIFNNIKDVFNK